MLREGAAIQFPNSFQEIYTTQSGQKYKYLNSPELAVMTRGSKIMLKRVSPLRSVSVELDLKHEEEILIRVLGE